jgi:hypothetical protein
MSAAATGSENENWQWWLCVAVVLVVVGGVLLLLRALWLRCTATRLAVDCGDECDDVRHHSKKKKKQHAIQFFFKI